MHGKIEINLFIINSLENSCVVTCGYDLWVLRSYSKKTLSWSQT